ncbi:MAG: 4Fe-4S dicluster domain-containing protein [Bacteroidales bacterium]|nr:4Fe-4S dicluster domain-containing protein [Bacteroidales bacterium]
MQLINIDLEKCNISHACIRACPVQAITIQKNTEYPEINHDRCIGCGSCLNVCAVNAVSYINSTDQTFDLLASDAKVAAIVDPSISGEFPDITDYRRFVEMIRTLGFDYVNEVSFGVDLVAREYNKLIKNFKGKYYITANCPSIVSYVEKYYPELVTNLTPIVTPMIATAMVVRKKFGDDIKVVYLGPCVSAKDEALRHDGPGKVDIVLTFHELREMFEKKNVKESTVEYSDFDEPIGYLGSLYPLSKGFISAADLNESIMESTIFTTDGKFNIMDAIDEFSQGPEVLKKHFNLFYNKGCLMGPGTTPDERKFLRKALVIDYSKKRLKDFDKKKWEKNMEFFSDLNLSRTFIKDDQRIEIPSEEQIEEILKSVGKSTDEKSSCNACGFRSCHDFAVSVSQGLAKPTTCLTYSLKNKQDFIKTLKTNNEKLRKTQHELEENEKLLKTENQKIKVQSDTISSLLHNLPSAVVIVDEKLKVIESNSSFVNILGEDAELINDVIPGLIGADLKTLLPYNVYNLFNYVLQKDENILSRDVNFNEGLLNISVFSLKSNKIVGAVFRDMYVAEVRQEEIINRVTDVIDENLKMVQQIAFSLGEGASKTEKMLNSIIETYKKIKKSE